MLRPDQSQSDRITRITERQAHEIAWHTLREKYRPVMGDFGKRAINDGSSIFQIVDAVVTQTISSASGGPSGIILGTGMVQLQYYDPSVSTTTLQVDQDGDDGMGNTVVWNTNTTGGTVGVGVVCKVHLGAAGWMLLTWNC
jgi:hypothetical protein